VPVVGPDVTMVKVDDAEQTFNSVIGQRLAERFGLTVPGLTTMDEAVAEFLRERGRDEVDLLYRVINDIIVELDPAPGDALRDLAAIDDLRLFVSTTPDRLLAKAVNEVRSPCRPAREITFSPTWSTKRIGTKCAGARGNRYHRSQSVWSSRLNSRVRDPRGGPNGVAAVLALRPGEPSRVA
jgi:hypothetical protein